MAGLNGTPMSSGWLEAGEGEPAAETTRQLADAAQDQVAVERARLEAEIAAATARTAAARHRAAALEAEGRAELRAELDASRLAVEEMERQHEATVAMIREAAQAEAERILAAARQLAAGQLAAAAASDQASVHDAQ